MGTTTNFYLDRKKDRKECLVFLYFRFNKKTLKYNTGLKIEEKYWNRDKQRVVRKYKFHQEFNANLSNFESLVWGAYLTLLKDGEPETKNLRKEVDKAMNRNEKQEVEFHKFVKQYIEQQEKMKAASLIKQYKKSYNHIKRFEEYRKKKITFEAITKEFNDSFVEYLHNERGLASNTVGSIIKHLKVFLNAATERGINKRLDYRKFKVSRRPSESAIFLDEKELDILMSMDLTDKERLEKVRDFFLVGCYTGLRYNDLAKLSTANIIEQGGKEYIKVLTTKTLVTVIVPLHENVKQIMKRYEGKFPPAISNQKLNKYLKELGELAGFTSEVVKIVIGAKKEKTIVPKYKLISTHTARRSFATNAILSGLTPTQVMKMTGHKTLQVFETYIRTTIMENARDLSNHDYFKK